MAANGCPPRPAHRAATSAPSAERRTPSAKPRGGDQPRRNCFDINFVELGVAI